MSALPLPLALCIPALLLAACAGGDRPGPGSDGSSVSGMRCLAALAGAGALAADWSAPRAGGCGVDTPVTLVAAGASLQPPLATSCAMALAWAQFVPQLERLAREHLGTGIAGVHHYGSHACRRMAGNGRRLSLHATARAIDVAGFDLVDGTQVLVARDWRGAGRRSDFLRAVAKTACGHFAVVLTPDHDRDHWDHLHFDIGPWRRCGL